MGRSGRETDRSRTARTPTWKCPRGTSIPGSSSPSSPIRRDAPGRRRCERRITELPRRTTELPRRAKLLRGISIELLVDFRALPPDGGIGSVGRRKPVAPPSSDPSDDCSSVGAFISVAATRPRRGESRSSPSCCTERIGGSTVRAGEEAGRDGKPTARHARNEPQHLRTHGQKESTYSHVGHCSHVP